MIKLNLKVPHLTIYSQYNEYVDPKSCYHEKLIILCYCAHFVAELNHSNSKCLFRYHSRASDVIIDRRRVCFHRYLIAERINRDTV